MPKALLKAKDDHTGFRFGFMRPGHPDFQVAGNCACLGVIPDAYPFRYHDWERGFASLKFHNIDKWESQGVALMAGAGTLASLCIEQTS